MEPVGVLDDVAIELLYLVDKLFALSAVGLLELADFIHDLVGVGVQVFEAVHRNVMLLLDFVHSDLDLLVLKIDFVF